MLSPKAFMGAALLLLAAAPAARAQNCSFRLDDSVPIADDAALKLTRWEFQIEVPDIADDAAAKAASLAIFSAAGAAVKAASPALAVYDAGGEPVCRDLYEDTELDVKPASLGETAELALVGAYAPPVEGFDSAKFSKYKVTFEPDTEGALGVNSSLANGVYSGLEAECEAGESKVYVDVRLPALPAAGPTAAEISAATEAGVGDPLEGLPSGSGAGGIYDLTGDKVGTRCHQNVFVKGTTLPYGQLAYEWEEEKKEMTLLLLLWNPEDASASAAERYEAAVAYAKEVYEAAEEYDPSAPAPAPAPAPTPSPSPAPGPAPPAPGSGAARACVGAAAAAVAALAALA